MWDIVPFWGLWLPFGMGEVRVRRSGGRGTRLGGVPKRPGWLAGRRSPCLDGGHN